MSRAHYIFMEAVAARISAPVADPQPHVTTAGLRHAFGNCILAVTFLLATIPAARELSFSLAGAANPVWLTGAAILRFGRLRSEGHKTVAAAQRIVGAEGGT